MNNLSLSNEQKFKLIRFIDGMNYTFILLDYSYSLLYESCLLIEKEKSNIAAALSHCWQIIDMTHRIREMCQNIPRLSKNDPNVKVFLQNTEPAEKFRHYVQHLRNELAKSNYDKFPVFGSLSWIDDKKPTKFYIAIIGTQLEGIANHGLVYDRLKKEFISKVALSVKNMTYNFDLIYKFTINFKSFIFAYFENLIPSLAITQRNNIQIIPLEVKSLP